MTTSTTIKSKFKIGDKVKILSDGRIVKVGELMPDIFHISHLRPYIESQPSNADNENEQQAVVNVNRPNANLNNLTDNQIRIMVAAAAMKGILCNTNIVKDYKDLDSGQEYVVKRAVAFTDALLEEINKKKINMGCECCREDNPRDYERCKVAKGLRYRNYTAPCGHNFVGNSNYTPPKKKKKRRK